MYKLRKYSYFLISKFPLLPKHSKKRRKHSQAFALRSSPCFLVSGSLKQVCDKVYIFSPSVTSNIYPSQTSFIAILILYNCMALGGYQSNWWLRFLIRKMKIITVFSFKVIIWNKEAILLCWICILSHASDISKATPLFCTCLLRLNIRIFMFIISIPTWGIEVDITLISGTNSVLFMKILWQTLASFTCFKLVIHNLGQYL